MIRQGEVYWVDLGEPQGPRFLRPHIVIQNNLFNRSRINTTVVCALASNLRRATSPGNVVLRRGEAKLPKKSVVNVSQVFTVKKSQLTEKIGSVSQRRLRQVLEGVALVLEPRDID